MKSYILLIIILFANFHALCQYQKAIVTLNTENNTDTIGIINLEEHKTYYSKVDLTPWKILKDSGMFNPQNEKNGFWKEFPIDTTIIDSDDNIKVQTSNSEIFEPEIIRREGNYINGKKDGLWKEYVASIRTNPFFWHLNKTMKYQDNMKNGKEIWFEPFSKDTMMIFLYENDEPIKQIK